LRPQLGLAGANDVREPVRRGGVDRVLPPELPRPGDLARVDVRDGDVTQLAAVVEQLDRAPVGERRHGELRDALERRLVLERRRQDLGDAREEREALAPGAIRNGLGHRGTSVRFAVSASASCCAETTFCLKVAPKPGNLPPVSRDLQYSE